MDTGRKKKFKIFIVDDVPANIQLAANILKKSGYDFFYAENGKKALSIAKENDFDLILLDIMMPEMDGYLVCEHLKKNPATRDIPIIFLTAKADMESIVKGLEAGAVDYVTKPFNDAELTARVKTHLELRRTQQSLREVNATKDKFFSIIAHDLKNPFNALIGLSGLLIKEYDHFDDKKKKQLIRNIYESSDNMYKLLENLLNWSRMQAGGMAMRPEHIHLKKLADENVALLKTAAENKNIYLFSDLDADATVYADADMVTLVFRNLITNAIKFTQDGGEIAITSKFAPNYQEISISDTGIGLVEEDIKKLFRIDIQHSTCGTAKERGSGLGLILCKEFIEKNGGEIWVESEFGKGSDFKFTLPKTKVSLADTITSRDSGMDARGAMPENRPERFQTLGSVPGEKEKDTEQTQAAEGADNQKNNFPLRILFVEDSEHNFIIAKLFLKGMPMQLDTAENGAIAVEKFKSGDYDIVVMDMQMPVMDGYAATRAIRSFEKNRGKKETPVIALSAYSTQEEIQLSLDAGCNDHLSKPINQDALIKMISKYTKPDAGE